MSTEAKLREAVDKVTRALAPHPRETQIEALRMLVAADPEVHVSLKEIDESQVLDANAVKSIDGAKAEIARVMEGLSPEARERVGRKLREQYAEEARKNAAARETRVEIERRIAALEELRVWDPPLVLERNEHPRLHILKEALRNGRVVDGSGETKDHLIAEPIEAVVGLQHTFVVKHDWAAAFEHAEGIEADEFKLPYDICAFEFRVAGRALILVATDLLGISALSTFIECGDYWYMPPPGAKGGEKCDPVVRFLWTQLRAICIALDAEVAVETVVRAPHKLNEKRVRAGKVPLVDHRVVDLARRHRVANPLAGTGTGSKKRLHFRRGHWRHYEESKTWIRWCLVGNPDLGFISKEYSL